MKAKRPHEFLIYASKFSLISMIVAVSKMAFDIFKNPSPKTSAFHKSCRYSVVINGKTIFGTALVAQTYLIDLVYDLICLRNIGTAKITHNEVLHLIALYNDYGNVRDKEKLRNKHDAFLNVYGFFGEQKRFQNNPILYDEFSRENYILNVVSTKKHPKNNYNIDVYQEFIRTSGFNPVEYATLVFAVYGFFTNSSPLMDSRKSQVKFNNSLLSASNIFKVVNKYSISIEEILNSPLKRQILYSKPIIRFGNYYISSNPFLVLCMFINCNYWFLRDLYQKKPVGNQHFVNAFGTYFEMYAEEILNNCLPQNTFIKIKETQEKRADWYIKLGEFDFLIEQKSGLSILGIKQSQPDIKMMKKHILKNWKEAVKQLEITQQALALTSPIKIILLYEDYYKSECLDELFRLDKSLNNDKNYWLVTIREFEMLMMSYKEKPELFFKIISEKIAAEKCNSHEGRDPIQFLNKHGISKNKYITTFGINKQFNAIKECIRQIV